MKPNVVLAGSLSFLNLGEILQLLGSSSASGVLCLTSRYALGPAYVYVSEGNPVDATAGALTGLDALYSLFGWLDGEFEFAPERIAEKRVIKKGRMELILDSLSMLDDGLIEKLGPETLAKKAATGADPLANLPVIRGPLVDYMYVVNEEDFYEGSRIAVEGKHGNWIWVILDGKVDILRETSQGPMKILRISEGAFVGSISAFLMGGNVRSATSVAVGNVQLGVLDSQRLAAEFGSMSRDFRQFAISIDRRMKQVTGRVVEAVDNHSRLKDFTKNRKVVIKQGQEENRLFVIRQGRAFVVQKAAKGFVPLIELKTDDVFGRIPFLDLGHEPYSAYVFGTDDLKVGKVDGEKLKKEYDGLSTTFRNLLDNLASCVSVTTKVAGEHYKRRKTKVSR